MTDLQDAPTTADQSTRDQSTRDPLGAPLDRRDGPAKVTGAATFFAEYPHEQLAYATPVFATLPHARILHIDDTAARALPGVVGVLTHTNAPKVAPSTKRFPVNIGLLARAMSIDMLQSDEVHFDGQPVALVLAETPEVADEAAALVTVDYEPLPAKVDLAAERGNATPMRAMPMPRTGGSKGDAKAALEQAEVVVDLDFTTPQHNHNAMELHGATARWDGDHLTLWEGTQQLEAVTKFVAARFGLKPQQVHVISPFVGGAFGGKSAAWPHTILAALAAKSVGRPVKLVLSREGVYRTVGGRPQTFQRVALGARADGTLTSIIHEVEMRKGTVGGSGEQVVSASADLYACDNIHLEQRIVALNLLPQTFMRAPGESIGTFALESAVDQLAYDLGQDPIDFRLRNQPDRHPLTGNPYSHHTLAESLREGANRFGWAGRSPEPGSMRDGRHLIGWGVASAVHPTFEFYANLTLRLTDDGRLRVRSAFHEMGMGAATATAQMAAHLMDLPVEAIDVEYGDSDLPWGPGAGGSAQTASIARALLAGTTDLRGQLERLSKEHGPGTPAEVLARAGTSALEAKVGGDTGFASLVGPTRMARQAYDALRRWSKAASGAHFCEVRIDADTGETRVTRWVGVFDIGRVVNAKTAASQLRGGIVMGLGLALSEATLVDPRNGRIMNASLTEYHVPVHADVPDIDVHMLDDPDPQMPLGVLGAGEVGITGVGAAVANAVFHATGRRVTDLPLTLDRVLG